MKPIIAPIPNEIVKDLFFKYIPAKEWAKTALVCKAWEELTKELTHITIVKTCTNEELVKKCCKSIELTKFVSECNFHKLENRHIIEIGITHPEVIFGSTLAQKLSDSDLLDIAASSLEATKAIQNYPTLRFRVENLHETLGAAFDFFFAGFSEQYYEFKSQISDISTSKMKF